MNVRAHAAGRLRSWAARRHGADTLPLTVQLRRIYILPTGFGLALAVLVLAMLLAGLNYNSNLGLALGFLLASLAMVAMHHCHRNLLGIRVDLPATIDAIAGASAELPVRLQNDAPFARYDIEVRCRDDARAVTAIAARGTVRASVAVPTERRGVQRLRGIELRTTWPLGWFRAWTYVEAPLDLYVAPRPLGAAAPPGNADAHGQAPAPGRRGDGDFAGLAPYSPGMPLKHLAWKTVARGAAPAVRTYGDLSGSPLWLDWDALGNLAPEARLAQLARWVVDADAGARPWGLRLPGRELAPERGQAQRIACLRALASWPDTRT